MASEHNGEKAGAKAVTVTKLNDTKAQTSLAETNASKMKQLVTPVAAIQTGLTPGGNTSAVFVKDALASVTQSTKAHVQPAQGKRVILTPLQATPTSPPTTSSAVAVPPAPPSSAVPLHPVRGAISVPLPTPVTPQSTTVCVDGVDHERPYHLRPIPPLIQDGPPPLQQMVHNGIVTDAAGGKDGSVPFQSAGGTLVPDHSYAAREPLAVPGGGAAPEHTAMSDSAEEMSGASSDEGVGNAVPPRPDAGTGTRIGPSSAPPKLLKRRGRPPNSTTNLTPGAKRPGDGHSPPTRSGGSFHLDGDRSKRRGRGCGGCPSCLRDDCGICRYCKDKPKFGGPGKKKQRCALRICSNFPLPLYAQVATPGGQRKKLSKPAPILPRPQPQVPPLIRPQDSILQGKMSAEKPNKEGVSRVLPMEVIQQPQAFNHTAVPPPANNSGPSLVDSGPAALPPVKQVLEKPTSTESAAGVETAVGTVVNKPTQVALPAEKHSEPEDTSKTPVVENGVPHSKKLRLETKAPPETKVTAETKTPTETKAAAVTKEPTDIRATAETKAPTETRATAETRVAVETRVTTEARAPVETRAPAEVRPVTEEKPQGPPTIPSKGLPPAVEGNASKDVAEGKGKPPSAPPTKIPRTRSQAERERSKSVSASEKVKELVKQAKQTVGRKRRSLASFGDLKMKCIFCGRQRKQAVARSARFCTQRCIQQWLEAHPGEDPEASTSEEEHASSSATRSKKPANSRELKNLQIDMALPGKTPPHPSPQQHSSPSKPLPPRTLRLSPRPAISPAASATKTVPPAKAVSDEDSAHTNTGTKRSSAAQPEAKKKQRESDHRGDASVSAPKEPNVIGSVRPTTTMVLPISAPLLTRTVPPPPVSIMHMNQIPSLASALSNLTEPRSHSRGLSSNIRNWSVEQVVQYFESTQDCRDYAEIFQEQDIDGSALLLLTHESLVKCLSIKLGRALKIMLHVDELKKHQESSE